MRYANDTNASEICININQRGLSIPHICHFFTQAKFLENKIYTEKRVNYDKIHSKLPFFLRYYDKIHSKLPIFRVKSVKIYTGQKKNLYGHVRGDRDKYQVCCHVYVMADPWLYLWTIKIN